MPSELVVRAEYQGDMRVTAGDGEHAVTMDYPLQAGQDLAGLTPLKLLLASLCGCAGNTIPMLLKKRDQRLRALEVTATGTRRDEHPTVLTSIDVEFVLHGDLDPDVVDHCIAIADEKLCPVWAMLRAGTPITTSYRIVD